MSIFRSLEHDLIRNLKFDDQRRRKDLWDSWTALTLSLLQYRNGGLDESLQLARRAIELYKDAGPDAHDIRAMEYMKLHNPDRAKKEILLAQSARQTVDSPDADDDPLLRKEAEALVSWRNR